MPAVPSEAPDMEERAKQTAEERQQLDDTPVAERTEVLQPGHTEQVEETFEEKADDGKAVQEQQPLVPTQQVPAHPRPKWAIKQAEHSEESTRETLPSGVITETKVQETIEETPVQPNESYDRKDPAPAEAGLNEVLATKDWPAMSSEAKVATQKLDEDNQQQEASMETAEDAVMQAIALLRSKGYAVEAQEKEVKHVAPFEDLVSVNSDCDYAPYGNTTPPSTPLRGTPTTDELLGVGLETAVSLQEEELLDDILPLVAASTTTPTDIPGLIQNLRLSHTRNGLKTLLLGHIQTRGREFALHTVQEPAVTAVLQEYICEHVPALRRRQFAIAVVEGHSSDWHVDANPEVYIANPIKFEGVVLQVEGFPDTTITQSFTAFNAMRKHRVISSNQRRLLVAYVPAHLRVGAQREVRFHVQGDPETLKVPYQRLWQETPLYEELSIGVSLRTIANWYCEKRHNFPLPDMWQVLGHCMRRMQGVWRTCQLPVGALVLHDDRVVSLDIVLPGHPRYDDRLNFAGGVLRGDGAHFDPSFPNVGSRAEVHLDSRLDQSELFRGGGSGGSPDPLFTGGGGGAPPNDGVLIKRIRDIDCRFTVHQARMLLSSNRVSRAANSGDYWSLRQAIEAEHKRLNLWPKGQVPDAPKRTQPTLREKEQAEISLLDDQITVAGQPVPVRAALRHDSAGVQLVNSASELKTLAYQHWRSSHDQYAVSPKVYTYGKEEQMDTITSKAVVLVINVTRGGQTQQLPTNLVLWRIAGGEPEVRGTHKCIKIAGNTTQVVRLKLTKAIRGQGVWIPPVLTMKDFKHVVKTVNPSLAARFCDVWQMPGMETTQVFLARVMQADVHAVMAEGAAAGLQVVNNMRDATSMKVLWLKARNMADAKKEAADLICELAEDATWKRASALCLRQEKNKLSYGIRVREEDYATVASAAGRDQRRRYVLSGCLQSWISWDITNICSELSWKAEVVRQLNKRTWIVVADEEPVVWRQLIESGYERTTLMIRPYEERQREQQNRAPEWKLGQRSWASVVQGPAAIKPEHQHDDHERDFWELREDSGEETPWDTTISSPQDMETEADEWANQCWQSWWTPESDDSRGEDHATMEDQRPSDGLDDDWVEKTHKRAHKKAEADKRGRVPGSNATSEEEHVRKQPRKEETPPGIEAIIQELREEKVQLRVENRELRAKLDEVLARLASTGVDGDHYEADITTGQYVLFPRTFAAEVSHQTGLYRHPWQASLQLAQRSDWENVSGEGNLCFWRCLLGMLANEGHQDS
eukprot:5635935-Amphidinium_carterae.1